MNEFKRIGGLLDETPVVKNLLLLNVLVFIACLIYPALTDIFAMHYPSNPEFKPWQLITHMFTHGGWMHIFFNMFALYNFGAILENERVLGSKRFAFLIFFQAFAPIFFHLRLKGLWPINIKATFFINNETALPPNLPA